MFTLAKCFSYAMNKHHQWPKLNWILVYIKNISKLAEISRLAKIIYKSQPEYNNKSLKEDT